MFLRFTPSIRDIKPVFFMPLFLTVVKECIIKFYADVAAILAKNG